MSINLIKENAVQTLNIRKQTLSICLEKKAMNNVVARVVVAMDKSGSMRNLYNNRTVQNVLERFFPLALKLDDNGELDIFLFHNRAIRMPSVDNSNFYNYVDDVVINGKYGKEFGGTSYAPIMKDIISKYVNEEPSSTIPTFVIFVTDGNNDDKMETKKVIIDASNHNIFWQFIGIGAEKFDFLKRLDTLSGRTIDNANFFEIKDIDKVDDGTLYDLLLNEFPEWQIEAKKIGILR